MLLENLKNKIIILSFSLCCFVSTAYEKYSWSEPYTAYLFAPGLWSSEHQAAKYCNEYRASTGEIIKGNHGFELINGYYTQSCNFSEIALVNKESLQQAQHSWWPASLLMHYVYKLGESILTKSNNRYKVTIEGESANGLTLNPYILNLFKLNFGQFEDVKIVSEAYDILCKNNPQKDVVLFGTSRGAAALILFIVLEYLKKPEKRVKAIILEGCYDSLENLTSMSYPISLFTNYNYLGLAPIRPFIVQLFAKICNYYKIPVLFVTSLKDQRVPYANSLNLWTSLQKAGLQDLDYLILRNSTHSAYLKDCPEDSQRYCTAIHAFYKRYGLSYIPS